MLTAEGKVLRPKDAAIKGDSDSWPEFGLTKTKITSQDTGDLVSLLTAHKTHPVKVEGFLDEVDDDQIHLVRDTKNYRKKAIVLSGVEAYAHAQYNDGTSGFWAAGEAGWFEVKDPVKVYEETFEDMIEATNMFYFLSDKYKNAVTRMPQANAKALERYAVAQFRSFLKHPRCRREDTSDVVKGFYQHRDFLIASMLEGQENLAWLDSQILRHLKHKFRLQNEYYAIEAKVALAVDTDDIERQITEEPQLATVTDGPRGKKRRACRRSSRPQTPSKQGEKPDEETDDEKGVNKVSGSNLTWKRKSILRPAGCKSSKKAAGRRQSFRSDQEEDKNSQNSQSGKSPTPANGIFAGADEDKAPIAVTTSPVASLMRESALSDLPVHRTIVKITQHALPPYEIQGPGDTWICQFDGCHYKVYNATKPESSEIIKSHFGTHSEQAQEKLDLIYKESRPYLPVK
ncbi:MAG: hypothetical protein LQ347_000207 [Umbilicaria vellea]|nr:MAG: hypothetical protein LQ347_000207 [Umbilicaria vellea]